MVVLVNQQILCLKVSTLLFKMEQRFNLISLLSLLVRFFILFFFDFYNLIQDCPIGYKPFTIDGNKTCLHLFHREIWIKTAYRRCEYNGSPILPKNSGYWHSIFQEKKLSLKRGRTTIIRCSSVTRR